MNSTLKNDDAIQIINSLPDDIRSRCLRPILEATEDAVQLEIEREDGEGECEYWMIDGDYFDAIVIVFPLEGEPMAADYDSQDWPDEAREKIIAAKDAYYA